MFQCACAGSHEQSAFLEEFTAHEAPFQTKFWSQDELATTSAPSGDETPSLQTNDCRYVTLPFGIDVRDSTPAVARLAMSGTA
ncbi:MAG: hypothetical protein QMC36_03135 [Patescibacteria group bacterium]